MPRYKITIEYDGTSYCGWQKQKNPLSIQQQIESAITKFAHETPEVFASGRTDAGVHAIGQVAHFDLVKEWDCDKIIGAINYHLKPNRICILACEKMDDAFHARFSAIERSYKYLILNRKSPAALHMNRVWHFPHKIDLEKMIQASGFFIGTHDFSSFRASQCQAKSPLKTINSLSIKHVGEEIEINIAARSFLHHMVRNIVGTLLDVGIGKMPPSHIGLILEQKDRAKAGQTAPACGLYFNNVKY